MSVQVCLILRLVFLAIFLERISSTELRERYREWCHEVGSSEKKGFLDYCEEYFESQDSIWDNLKDEYEDE